MYKSTRYTPRSSPPPKTPNSSEISKKLSTLLNQKKIKWITVTKILQQNGNSTKLIDSLRRQALKRACLDTSVCPTALKLLLQKGKPIITLSQRAKYAMMAVRCQNMTALQSIIYDNVSVLYYSSTSISASVDDDSDGIYVSVRGGSRGDGSTLLHKVCEKHGWNEEVAFVLKETLENRDDEEHSHEGMFQEMNYNSDTMNNYDGVIENEYGHDHEAVDMPLKLALQAGADLAEIVYHLREEYPIYLEKKLFHLSEIVAEYCYDMTLYQELLELYPHILDVRNYHPTTRSSPLHFACYYQNKSMIHILLEAYRKREGRKILLRKRLLARNKEGMSPLGHLVLNVGDRDDDNAWECIHLCANFFESDQFRLLHLVFHHMWDELARKQTRIAQRIIQQIVLRLRVNLFDMDEDGKTVLTIFIGNIAFCQDKAILSLSMQILSYLLSHSNSNCGISVMNPACAVDGKGRLPLHWACESALNWKRGLESLVNANVSALNEYDPVTDLLPFSLAAVRNKSNLDSIYMLLRHNPGVL